MRGVDGEWRRLLGHLSRIVDVYDFMNRVMSLGLDIPARREFIRRLDELCGEPRVVLEAGCGPGTLIELMLEEGPRYVVGVDPLPEMAEAARRRLSGRIVDLVVAVGEHLPVRSGGVDAAVAAFALRDYVDWRRGLAEMARVSRRCFAVLDIRRRRGAAFVAQLAWWGVAVPIAAALLARRNPTHYVALAKTIVRWAGVEEIASEASRYGRVEVETFAGGFAFRLYTLLAPKESGARRDRGQRYTPRHTRGAGTRRESG